MTQDYTLRTLPHWPSTWAKFSFRFFRVDEILPLLHLVHIIRHARCSFLFLSILFFSFLVVLMKRARAFKKNTVIIRKGEHLFLIISKRLCLLAETESRDGESPNAPWTPVFIKSHDGKSRSYVSRVTEKSFTSARHCGSARYGLKKYFSFLRKRFWALWM